MKVGTSEVGAAATASHTGTLAGADAGYAAAFEAAEFLMDYLKSRAPFWKKEIGAEGEAWVAAKDADEVALKRW